MKGFRERRPALMKWKCREPALEAAASSTGKNLKTVVWRAGRKDAKPAPTLQLALTVEENRMCSNLAKPAIEMVSRLYRAGSRKLSRLS
ncbi:hypothetical protein SLEP1_g46621 [Rubroshorea leprosula]|uniref:Uncharacterized protein n=1 Tax=Rubroshorea leprosula TaxID=152421 RepID=A0AAV5LQI2_9ROSI|nr:hypothetical protein SLEP1_g46621 [Rubroshorea leprosula]